MLMNVNGRWRQRGFTLVELMLVIVILGILFALAYPDYELWIENIKTRNFADSVQNGLRLTRAEAARRNSNVDFVLTKARPNNDKDSNVDVAGDPAGTNWLVRVNDGGPGFTTSDYIQSQLEREGSAGVTVNLKHSNGNASSGVITFTGLGNITPAADYLMEISNRRGDRPLHVTISRAGQVRMCDPDKKLSDKDPRRC